MPTDDGYRRDAFERRFLRLLDREQPLHSDGEVTVIDGVPVRFVKRLPEPSLRDRLPFVITL